jgi:hypothetical protein
MRAYMACLLTILALSTPEAALARTDARVTAVAAQLDVRDASLARVELVVHFLVRSGPISSFDLEGLDPDFELLEVEAPAGATTPQVVNDLPGQLQFLWSDPRTAPKPGEHTLRVLYATHHLYSDPTDPRTRRIDWSLPRWPERLTNVQVTVIGPPGLRPTQSEPNFGEQVELLPPPPNAARMLRFTRVELPRLTSYHVRFELPLLTAANAGANPFDRALAALKRNLVRNLSLLLIGVCLGGLIVAKRRVRRKRLVTPRMLVPRLEPRSFDGPIFVCAALAPLLIERTPLLALVTGLWAVASALERKRTRSRPAASSREASESAPNPQWLSAHAALDATTAPGVLCLAMLLGAAMFAPEPLRTTAFVFGWLATPLFFSGTRLTKTHEEPGN